MSRGSKKKNNNNTRQHHQSDRLLAQRYIMVRHNASHVSRGHHLNNVLSQHLYYTCTITLLHLYYNTAAQQQLYDEQAQNEQTQKSAIICFQINANRARFRTQCYYSYSEIKAKNISPFKEEEVRVQQRRGLHRPRHRIHRPSHRTPHSTVYCY